MGGNAADETWAPRVQSQGKKMTLSVDADGGLET